MKLSAQRSTKETSVRVDLADTDGDLDVTVAWAAHGGLDEAIEPGMAEHLYTALLHYANLSGGLEAEGDLAHHVVEDAAITLGTAIGHRVDEDPIVRFAEATVPMDEALVQVVLDAGGRPFYDGGDLDAFSPLWNHVCRSIAFNAHATLHVRVLRGTDQHHVVEATLKALGQCLSTALQDADEVASTKGRVRGD